MLLLVDLKEEPGLTVRFEPAIAARLFEVLWPCLRETDFLGWYRENQVAGAVLTHIGETADTDISALISQRVGDALRGDLPAHIGRRLQVRVYQRPPTTKTGRS
jgi:hypothetical protein